MTPRRILPPLTAALSVVFLSACDLRPHADVVVVPPPIPRAELFDQVVDTMGSLGYQPVEFVAVKGTPVPREEAAFRALHPGLHNRDYGDALRNDVRSTVLERRGSSKMYFVAGLSEAWVTLDEDGRRSLAFDLTQTTNRFISFDEFGRREYQLLVEALNTRFGANNVRPSSRVD